MDVSLPGVPSEGTTVHRLDLRSLKTCLKPGLKTGRLSILAFVLAQIPLSASATPQTQIPVAGPRPNGVTIGLTTGGWTVDYDGFAHGILALKMHATLNLTPAAYEGTLSFHTAGMIGWMVHTTDDSNVQGRFVKADADDTAADRADPSSFVSVGNLRGTERITRMTYQNGTPVIGTLTPDVLLERTAVPPSAWPHTIDNLSALAMLVRQVADTGRCDGDATLFDGRRLTTLAARTANPETLPHTGRSIFAGQTLRCDFDGNQLYGFKHDESEAEQRRTKHGNAWLATVLPNEPPIPVKVIFTNKALGEVTLYLTAATPAPGAVAQLPTAGVH
jgi:hypothetical protein